MLAIRIDFLAGRYHATPWGSHVNEGDVEWPPSPWRILRALIATWHRKALELDEDTVRAVVEKLAGGAPSYRLPNVTSAHTRHYMPPFKGNTTKVFDAFLHVASNEPLHIVWPSIELDEQQRDVLDTLVSRCGYLGRAESWVEMTLSDEPVGANAAPYLDEFGASPSSGEIVELLAPQPPSVFAERREHYVRSLEANALAVKQDRAAQKGNDPNKAKLTKTDRTKAAAAVAESVFDALQIDSADVQEFGGNRPPGSRWIRYVRPAGVLRPSPRDVAPATLLTRPTVARFALASAVVPQLTMALSLTERVHQSLAKISDGAPVFTGLSADGAPLKGHEHAHIFAEASEAGEQISHVSVWAPRGFTDEEVQSLRQLRKVWGHANHDVFLVLVGLGRREDFDGSNQALDISPLFGTSRTWTSLTPFVATRHPKKGRVDPGGRIVGSREHDLVRLLQLNGHPEPTHIERVERFERGGRGHSWLKFRAKRTTGRGRRANATPCGFRITFDEPVSGPIVAGFGQHFGLGAFVPASERD